MIGWFYLKLGNAISYLKNQTFPNEYINLHGRLNCIYIVLLKVHLCLSFSRIDRINVFEVTYVIKMCTVAGYCITLELPILRTKW